MDSTNDTIADQPTLNHNPSIEETSFPGPPASPGMGTCTCWLIQFLLMQVNSGYGLKMDYPQHHRGSEQRLCLERGSTGGPDDTRLYLNVDT